MRIWWYRVLYVRSSFQIKKWNRSITFDWVVSFCASPRSGERVQGTKFLAGVWGEAPSRFGRQPNVTPILKKENVVSAQNAKHSAIETGSSRNKHVGTPKPTAVRERSETWRWISANFSIKCKRPKLCIFPAISKKNAAFTPQKPAFRWKRFKKCQKKIKKGVDTGTKSRYNNWAVSARH